MGSEKSNTHGRFAALENTVEAFSDWLDKSKVLM